MCEHTRRVTPSWFHRWWHWSSVESRRPHALLQSGKLRRDPAIDGRCRDGDCGLLETRNAVPFLDMRVPTPAGIIEQYAASTNWGPRYDVFPDGRLVMLRGTDPQGTREIVLVQNFFEEVNRLAPPR